MNLTKFSPSCSHIFGITIFEQEDGKRAIPLYQTWHIVNSITLYQIVSLPHPILSYSIVSYLILLYHITSNHNTSNPPSSLSRKGAF